MNCWVDGQGDGAKEVFHAAGGSRLRFVDTKGFWNPENFWDVTDGVVDTPSYEGYREGVDDIRYATLLRMLCQKHPGPRADAATKMLDAINVYERGFDSGWMRLQIIEAILDLLEM